jgi:translation initiation factor IF-3
MRPMGPRRPPYAPQNSVKALRKNDRIRVPEVRVIGPDGKQIGILNTREALRIAQTHGLDLVEVSPGMRPPVCKIVDYGKFMYEQGKKQKDHKAHPSKLKEVKIRPLIEQHDYITKLRHAEEFLFHANKVKLTLSFKGRQMEHKDVGFETVKRFVGDLAHVGTADQPPRMFGRNIMLTLSPLPPNKRKLKFNLREGEESPPAPTGHEHGHGHGHEHGHDHGHQPAHSHDAPKTPPASGAVASSSASPESSSPSVPTPPPAAPAPGV